MSMRFEAPITITLSSRSTPSSSARNCGTIVVSTSEETPEPRVRSKASISSMNTITGRPSRARSRARSKMRRISRSDSPTYLLSSSGPLTERNTPLPSAPCASECATAFAISVLPLPGGPYNSTPFGGFNAKRANRARCVNGSSTASLIVAICSSRPPMSWKVTSGVSSSTRLSVCSRGSTCTANRADVSSITRSAPLMRACRRSCARSTTVRAPEASETMRRPSSSSSSTWRTTPQRSAAAVPVMTMFSLTSSVIPGASRAALTVGATGSTTRRLPWSTSAHACCTPCESVEQRSNRSIAAKVSGGWANCSSCALALASSSPARVNACANAWFFACRRSFNCARFSCSSIAPRFP